MGNRIVISGYYGFGNLGDEAVLCSMLQALRSEIPHLEITVLSNDPEITFREYGVLAVNRWELSALCRISRSSVSPATAAFCIIWQKWKLPYVTIFLPLLLSTTTAVWACAASR